MHTPGHTPEHMAYLATEKGNPWGFFSGDFLFADSVGRPDLLGASQTPGLAKALFTSLWTTLAPLPDAVPLYPAHGAGSPCGANICDRQSTIGHERRHNPALQFTDESAFIDWVLRTAPPMPRYYPRMKRINAQGPEVLNGLPAVEWLEPAAFRRRLPTGAVQLIDNRTMAAFGGGHIDGAWNLGPRAELSLWAGWMLDEALPIALVLPGDGDLPEVLRQFLRVGFTKFAGCLKGGMEAWITAGLRVQGLAQTPVHELNTLLPSRDFQLLDVRSPIEWDQGHLPGARYLFLGELPEKLKDLDRDTPVAVYCPSGYRSSLATSLLQASGFRKVQNVPGGYTAWTSWHQHMSLVGLAHLFVTLTRRRLKRDTPDLTLDMALRLLKSALPRPELTEAKALELLHYHLRRNRRAKDSHYKPGEKSISTSSSKCCCRTDTGFPRARS
jgi:hydroxyacylglutathione hydrolase